MKKNKTIVITGGTGYVGSRVARILAEEGNRVIAVDIATPEERGIAFPEGVEFRRHDLRIPEEAVKGLAGGDIVLHLAADIGPLTYMFEHQADIMTNNTAIDAAVYPALLANGIRAIIYSSSSMVFQHPPKFPYTESDIHKIDPPTNIYGFSKFVGEYFCRSYATQHDLNYTILRYHNIYGPGEDIKGSTPGDIHVIPALLEKVFSGQYPLEFLGSPESTRPFVFVDDAVSATLKILARALADDPVVRNEDFNIGNDRHYTILELGKLIWEAFGDGREFQYLTREIPAITAHRREVDITKVRESIGWEPKVSLDEGIQHTARWIRERGTGQRSLWK